MATIRNNVLTEGLRGMIGDQLVFRQLRGKTVVSASPGSPGKESAQQRKNRHRFRKATEFAKAMMRDPEKKKYYWVKAKQHNLPNAYTAAITDYLRKPEVSSVRYKGSSRENIVITAGKKGFAVDSVTVAVMDAGGNTLATYAARQKASGQCKWMARLPMSRGDDSRIVITVMDRIGNRVQRTG